jgi:hypothetical protein
MEYVPMKQINVVTCYEECKKLAEDLSIEFSLDHNYENFVLKKSGERLFHNDDIKKIKAFLWGYKKALAE